MSVAQYDSRPETYQHIAHVRGYLLEIVMDLLQRADGHDISKLEEPELSTFNTFTPKLDGSTYGSDEYKGFLEAMGPGLRHHYEANDHHPEHGGGGVDWMNLIQVLEMLADWKAATLRHEDGDLARSIEINAERFGYGPEIESLLMNTALYLGWVSEDS